MLSVLSAPVVCVRFVEHIPPHITPKSGFESFAEYTQCLQEGTVRLQATSDIHAGDEIYVRHAPGTSSGLVFTRMAALQVQCMSSKLPYLVT